MRKYLIVAAALAVAVTALFTVGVAYGASANNDSLSAKFNPDNPGNVNTPGGLFAELSSLHNTDSTGTPTSPTVEPVPTTNVSIDFDHAFTFKTKTVGVCNNGLTGTTQQGMQACGDSYIGGGYATVCASGGGAGTPCGTGLPANTGIFNAQVSVYNGPPDGKHPTLKLQAVADHTPLGPTTVPLVGTLVKSKAGGEFAGGKRLDVPVPVLGGGLAALTDFSVNINNGSYVTAACDNGTWNIQSTSTDAGGSQTDVVNQPCT